MRRSSRRLLVLVLSLPALLLALTSLYMLGMHHLEGDPRAFWAALEWASETLTTTGYGKDAAWDHPLMVCFVVAVQFAGVFLVFLVVPVFLIPFLEERFEGRLQTRLPELDGKVVVYHYGPAVVTLLEELTHAGVEAVVIEEDEATARRLRDRGVPVVHRSIEDEESDLTGLAAARAIVANASDAQNAVMVLTARQVGFTGPIVTLVEEPKRRNPLLRAGATAAFTPSHILAAEIAGKASARINPRLSGAQPLGTHLQVTELRVDRASSLAGKTLAEAAIREKTGATIIGQWVGGDLVSQPPPDARIHAGTILVAAGSAASIERLADVARPIATDGPVLVVGYGEVGRKVTQFLRDAGETVVVIDPDPDEGVDHVGDALDPDILGRAGIAGARALILAMDSDAETVFGAAVARDLVADVAIIASVERPENVARIHRAGADFALSVSQVAGQLLAFQILGRESVSLQPQIKLVKTGAGALEGKNPIESQVRARTGCSIIAVERGGRVIVDFDQSFAVLTGDQVYICGSPEAVASYFQVFPELGANA